MRTIYRKNKEARYLNGIEGMIINTIEGYLEYPNAKEGQGT